MSNSLPNKGSRRVGRRAARVSLVSLALAGLVAGSVSLVPPGARASPEDKADAAAEQTPDARTAAPDPASRERIQQQLDAMVDAGAPGVYARITDERGTWTARSGVADVETGRPIPKNPSFRAASITKSLVATVVLQLVDEGRLKLDDRVGALLPGVVRNGDEMTVRQLLRHTSGFPDYIGAPGFTEPQEYIHRKFTPTQLIDVANQLDPTGEPGEGWAYSNAGYIALGMIIENATGKQLPRALQDRVLTPARMDDSYLASRPGVPRGPHAKGYHLPENGPLVEMTRLDPSFAWAAYALVSTPADVERFYRTLWSGKLLSSESLDRMKTTVQTSNPYFPGYGMGLESMNLTCSQPGLGHTGSIAGYNSFAFSSADARRSVVISINAQLEGSRATPVILEALNAINLEFCGEELPAPSGAPLQLPDNAG